MATLIKPDGTKTEVRPKNGKDFTIAELYTLIECTTVEVLYMAEGKSMWIDEEGKFKNPLHNLVAEMILRDSLHKIGRAMIPGDYLVGNALVCDEGEVR